MQNQDPSINERTDEYRSRSGHWIVAICFLVIVGISIFHYLSIVSDPYVGYRFGDELYYHNWAKAISHGQLAKGSVYFASPLYAYLLGFFYFISSDHIATVLILNFFLGTGTLIFLYLTARILSDRLSAVFSLVLYGFCIGPLFYGSFADKTSLVLFFTSMSFYLVSKGNAGGGIFYWISAGIAFGLSTLSHPLMLIVLPAACLYVAIRYKKNRAVPIISTLILTTMLTISPATIHNYIQEKIFVLVTNQAGVTFYIFNHAGNSTGLYTSPAFAKANFGSETNDYKIEAEKKTRRKMTSAEVSSYWLRQGLREVLENPKLSLVRFIRRLNWSISNQEITDTRNIDFYKIRFTLFRFPFLGFGVLSTLGIIGMIISCRKSQFYFCCWFILLFIVSLSIFAPYGRYRIPLIVPFAIMGGTCLKYLYQTVSNKNHHRLFLFVLILIPISWLTHRAVLPENPKSFFTDFYNMGNKYLQEGKIEMALQEYENALWVKPGNHPAVNMLTIELSKIYINRGQFNRAKDLLEKAVSTYPDRKEFRDRLLFLKTRENHK